MGKTRIIKDALVTVLSGIQYEGEPAFVEVKDNTDGEFDGYPSVRLLPGSIDNTKGSMAQMDRAIEYQAVIHLQLEDANNIRSEIINQIYDLTDLVIDALDEADFDDALREQVGGSYLLRADRVDWDVVDSSAGALIMLVVTITAEYSKNL
ncbi:hypothetical protein QM806_04355 [Rhodococcus sp. IEGM 1351]|uniref:hypothetical protein n=1 Tax=Rhodococcus sp. IEGM 1351 TaxID=3047089 RepID=UPI0024B6A7F6|nr:hypothetical protein [Rhodococcus sp. IEGM 1351]MDI9934686.1 hypothetical protein [Rhodococcus sp. IEGM 1351]